MEIDISFRVQKKEDIVQNFVPIYASNSTDKLKGVRIENVMCFVYVKEYLYQVNSLLSRVNMTYIKDE